DRRHVPRCGGRGGGEARAGRGGGVPAHAGEVRAAGREDPQGRAAGGAARHGQDAARAGGGGRGGGDLLLDQRVRVRGDVRGRGRCAGAGPVRPGEGERAVHRV